MRILTCYNNIMHPGIAKLVSRLVWECCSCIRDRVRRYAASLATPAFVGFSSIAESGIKVALTTGMTTDRKIFDFPLRRGIMAEK